MIQPVSSLVTGQSAIIIRLEGGFHFRKKMSAMGIREHKIVRLVAKFPFYGPVVIEVDGREITIGRRMAAHIITGDPV